jgi:hypothetical protein
MRARFGLKLQVVTGCKGCERKGVHLCECFVRGGEWWGCCPKSSVKIGTAVDEIKLSATPQQLLQCKLFVAVNKNTARGAERSHSSCCELVVCRCERNALMKIRGMAGKFWGAAESWAKRNTMATKYRHGRLRRCAIDMKKSYNGARCVVQCD